MEKTYVFVYGTLKPGEKNYLSYCAGRTMAETKAYTLGHLYHLPLGYPAMAFGKQKVEGYLLTFPNTSILTSLDELEDYQPDRSPNLNEYNRQQVFVYSLTADVLGKAWVYLMNLEKIQQAQGKFINSGCWSGKFFIYR